MVVLDVAGAADAAVAVVAAVAAVAVAVATGAATPAVAAAAAADLDVGAVVGAFNTIQGGYSYSQESEAWKVGGIVKIH
jgi:hypothetical protein